MSGHSGWCGLEELWRRLPGILEGAAGKPELELRAIDAMLKVLVHEARLMGLDAPPKRMGEVVTDELLQRLIAEEPRAIAAQRALLDSWGDGVPQGNAGNGVTPAPD